MSISPPKCASMIARASSWRGARFGRFTFHVPATWFTTNALSPRTRRSFVTPRSAATRSPLVSAAYSASLFVHRSPRYSASSKTIASSASRRSRAPAPLGPGLPRHAPSKKSVCGPRGSEGPGGSEGGARRGGARGTTRHAAAGVGVGVGPGVGPGVGGVGGRSGGRRERVAGGRRARRPAGSPGRVRVRARGFVAEDASLLLDPSRSLGVRAEGLVHRAAVARHLAARLVPRAVHPGDATARDGVELLARHRRVRTRRRRAGGRARRGADDERRRRANGNHESDEGGCRTCTAHAGALYESF